MALTKSRFFFLFSVMLIIWGSYGSKGIAWSLNRIFRCFHPKSVGKMAAKAKNAKFEAPKMPGAFLRSFSGPGGRQLSASELKELNDMMPVNDLVGSADFAAVFNHDDINVEIEDEEAMDSSRKSASSKEGLKEAYKPSVRFHYDGNQAFVSTKELAAASQGYMSTRALPAASATASSVRQRRARFDENPVMEDHTGSGALELSEHGTIDREASTFLSEGSYQNVDWIGRWIVVPSYMIIMGTLVGTGWGYYERG